MLTWVLLIGGAAALLYFDPLKLGAVSVLAEGKSWQVVKGGSTIDWPKVYPDAVSRLGGNAVTHFVVINENGVPTSRSFVTKAWLALRVRSKESAAMMPMAVEVTRAIDATHLEGKFIDLPNMPLAIPWGPKAGTLVTFEMSDVHMIVED